MIDREKFQRPEVERPVRNTAAREQKREGTRQRGVFNGTRQRLEVLGTIPGHVMYWFTDTDGRIERAQTAWWDFVTKTDGVMVPGGNSGVQSVDEADRFRTVVGQKEDGKPLYAYLMKIQQEYYEEDQSDTRNENQRRMDALKKSDGAESEAVEKRFVPRGRKKALDMASGTFSEFSKAS